MSKQAQVETRGRKPNPRGTIVSNGLFEEQWAKLQSDAQSQGIEGAVLLRRIVDWYYDALEKQDGKYSQKAEFETLPKE